MAKGYDLPQELIEAIVACLHDDHKALAACSLVARSWLPSCRFHQFRQVSVHDDRFGVFTQMTTANPHIASRIQELTLTSSSTPVRAQTLLDVLANLASLHTVKLWGFRVEPSADSTVQYLDIPALRLLEVSSCDATHGLDFLRLLAIFSRTRVARLRLHEDDVAGVSDEDVINNCAIPYFQAPWKVRDVSIANGSRGYLLKFLTRVIDPESLYNLDIGELSRPHIEVAFPRFVTTAGSALRHMRWDVTSLYVSPIQAHSIPLQFCASLESLELYLGAGYYYDRMSRLEERTSAFPGFLIRQLPSQLRVLTLAFGLDYEGTFFRSWLDCVDNVDLDKVLLQMCNLEELQFIVEHPTPAPMTPHSEYAVPAALRKDIETAFPGLANAGKLRFPDSGSPLWWC